MIILCPSCHKKDEIVPLQAKADSDHAFCPKCDFTLPKSASLIKQEEA